VYHMGKCTKQFHFGSNDRNVTAWTGMVLGVSGCEGLGREIIPAHTVSFGALLVQRHVA